MISRWNVQRGLLYQAIFELIFTENSYVRDLQLMVEVHFIWFSLTTCYRLNNLLDILLQNPTSIG